MENFRELIDTFVKFYNSLELPLQFGIILILCVIGLLLLVYIPKGIVCLVQWIISLFSKKKEESDKENSSIESQTPVNPVMVVAGSAMNSDKERKVSQYFGDELRKFSADADAIYARELKGENPAPAPSHTIEKISDENKAELSEQRKAEIRSHFENLGTKELKRQQAAFEKKQESVAKELGDINLTYKALLVSRDQAQDRCSTLYQKHKESLANATECREKFRADAEECKRELAGEKAYLDQKVIEKDRILAELEQNQKDANEVMEAGGKQIVYARTLYMNAKKDITEAHELYQEDAAAYLGGVSELNAIDRDLADYLNRYGSGVRQKLEFAYSIECIDEILTAIQKELEEKRIREEEEAAQREREKAEKKAEEKRLAKEKAEAERLARQKAAEERARREAEEKAEAERLAILQSQQEMNESNKRADDAASKAAELDDREKALEEKMAAVEAQKRSIEEERARERLEKEQRKAANKAERERKEAQEKAERAAREKAELEALEELTDEEREMRRTLEQINGQFDSRSALAAEEGFVNEKRINEIQESQRTFEEERAKREAEKEARQRAIDENHSRIMDAEAAIADESVTPEERMDALQQQWRAERENKERFEQEKSRKARETEQRRQELASLKKENQE